MDTGLPPEVEAAHARLVVAEAALVTAKELWKKMRDDVPEYAALRDARENAKAMQNELNEAVQLHRQPRLPGIGKE
jgi:hypothetical protein